MAKKTNDSQGPVSSSATKTPEEASPRRMVLRVRQGEAKKRLSSLMRAEEGEKRAVSVKRSKTKQKKKGAKVDPNMPKKPPTAFFYFLEDFRKEFQEQNPDVKTMQKVGKAGGEKWKTLSYEGKVKYYDIAMKKRAEFDEAMSEYIERKESGEGDETEDDEDYDI
ncbi:high mobility group B protein 14 [Argentina anserina]|uniref:high mobility group B protein 14 n=1 Tax=Argentina anserina TaxID=57926 RepID=UPI00217667C3|nr:high mobility group B protein 14 [Potentilla anserina]